MLKQMQAISGAIFAAFVAVHLLNTWTAALSPGIYDGLQSTLRAVYQFAPIEALLLAALAVHMVVGVMRIVREPKRELNLRAKLHRYAGFFLLIFILGHITAVRGSSWFFDVYPRFEGLAFSIEMVPGYFYPYYFLLGLAGFYHGLNGLGIALGRLGLQVRIPAAQLRIATAGAGALMVVALMGFGGFWFDTGDPSQSEFAHLTLELVGESAP